MEFYGSLIETLTPIPSTVESPSDPVAEPGVLVPPVPGIPVGIDRLMLSSPDIAPSTPLTILSSTPVCLVDADDIARLLGVATDNPEVTLCACGPAEWDRLGPEPPPTPSLPPSPSERSDLELKSVLLYPPAPLISDEYPPVGLYLLNYGKTS